MSESNDVIVIYRLHTFTYDIHLSCLDGFCMAVLMFLKCHRKNARTHSCAENNFSTFMHVTSCSPSPDNVYHWELRNFHMGMGSCGIALVTFPVDIGV